ncbi:MAG: hypothetical protein ACTHLN_03730 [Tepidisphaeraceae bacterium]
MGMRERIERNKRWLIPVIFGLGLVALFASLWKTQADNALPGSISQAYYTVDDGKSYFADDVNKPFPFDHGGKPAYRAYVFRCGSGKPFVAAIGRQGAGAVPENTQYHSDKSGGPIEIKKPGDDKWFAFASAEGQRIIRGSCPDGAPEAVLP